MANKKVTDLTAITTAPISGVMHFIDTTDTSQNAAGSSFKVTKADLLKENTAAILLNTAKIGITQTQATDITNNIAKVGYTDALVAAAPSVLANTAKVGITVGQSSAITANTSKISYTDALVATAPTVVANTAKVGITSVQSSAIVANTAKVGITPAQATAITDNTANTSKVSINNDAASIANVRSLRYREETYSSNIDMVMQTNVGVYNWSTIFSVAFNIANAIIARFKARVATDGGTFEAEALTEARLNSIATLNLATYVMGVNSFNSSKIYAAFPNLASSDFSFTRNSTASRINSAGNREVVAINTPIINYPVSGAAPELLLEPQRTNLLLNSDVLVTQSITTTAAAHALSFTGTGTVTLTGTFSGSLTGTGANNVVSLNFTPTAGTLTVTISGSCSLGQIEAGVNATANIPTLEAAVTRVTAINVVLNDLITKGVMSANQGAVFLKLGLVSDTSSFFPLVNLSTTNNTSERIAIGAQNGNLRILVIISGATAISFIPSTPILNDANVAVSYLNGVYKIFANGALLFTSSAVTQNAYTSMQLTDSFSAGKINASRSYKSLLLYNTALSDAQAITLTT